MAGDIGVKMGVSGVQQFKQAMTQSQQSVKTLDAQLKLNEKQLQATGDKETYMAEKSKLLKKQIQEQSNVVKQGQQALQQMERNGVSPASSAYQKMQQNVLNAQGALLDMQGSLQAVGQSTQDTAQKTDRLTDSLNSINKKVSFDAVLNGIGKITAGMEAAARHVARIASGIYNTMKDTANWADDVLTQADIYGLTVTEYQQMKLLENNFEFTVDAMMTAQQKIAKGVYENREAFESLGITLDRTFTKYGEVTTEMPSTKDIFWDLGEAIMAINDPIEQEYWAMQLLGKSWKDFRPLFSRGREEFETAMADVSVVAEESVGKLATAADAVTDMEESWATVKTSALAALAEPLTEIAGAIQRALDRLNEYLNSAEGQQKLKELGESIEGLFDSIINADPEQIIGRVKDTITGIVDAFKWIKEHSGDIVNAVKAIGIAFLTLKTAEILGTMVQAANALKQLLGKGAESASAGGLFASGGVISSVGKFLGGKVLPIVGGAALGLSIGNALAGQGFTPIAHTADDQWDSFYDRNGNVTEAGMAAGLPPTQAEYQALMDAERDDYAARFPYRYTSYLASRSAAASLLGKTPGTTISGGRWAAEVEEQSRELDNYIAGMQTSDIADVGELSVEELSDLAKRIFGLGLSAGFAHDFESLDELYRALKNEEKLALEPPTPTQTEEERLMALFGLSDLSAGSISALKDRMTEQAKQLVIDAWHENGEQLMYQDAHARIMEGLGGTLQDYEAIIQMLTLMEQAPPDVPVDPQLPEDKADMLQEQLEGVALHVPVIPDLVKTGLSDDGEDEVSIGFANGLPFVPFDGYIAALHRGERVLTAAQNRSYTYNSNTYFGAVNLNNGLEVEALSESLARQNAKMNRAYGQ